MYFLVDIIVPVPLPQLFTYCVSEEMAEEIQPGQRVVVPFGNRKVVTAIVYATRKESQYGGRLRYIMEILDDQPSVLPIQMEFWKWMSAYYSCAIGECMQAALPSGLKLSSHSLLQLHPEFTFESAKSEHFQEKEWLILETLFHRKDMKTEELPALLEVKHPYPYLRSLLKKNCILIFEQYKEKYSPKIQKRIRLSQPILSAEHLDDFMDAKKLTEKQAQIVMAYLAKVPISLFKERNPKGIGSKEFLKEYSQLSENVLKTLVKREIFEEFEVQVPRFAFEGLGGKHNLPSLTLAQKRTFEKLLESFQTKDFALLEGITGSGKTEIYIRMIELTLKAHKQVLFLLPEIALTSQMVQRLQKAFGNSIGIYHSQFSDNERVEVWKGLLNGNIQFVIGVRSALFLPFSRLGLLIVDEEHDSSYKQYEPAPRYQGRDSALVLAKMHQAKVLLGSATPSLETIYMCQKGQYAHVRLDERFGEASLPRIQCIDTKKAIQEKQMKGLFSVELLDAMEKTIQAKGQVILFQNRRGYAPILSCELCSWTPKCENCSVSLTYHMYRNEGKCHYCGYSIPPPIACPECSSSKIHSLGFGTEQIEDELRQLRPQWKSLRLDRDSSRTRTAHERIIEEFSHGDVQVLIGTQMVSKGLDFSRVQLVGIFDVDRMLHYPDFRAAERLLQMLIQVSGRAGRRAVQGLVCIQTAKPEHPIFSYLKSHAYPSFYSHEMEGREKHFYPPFCRMIHIQLKHEDPNICAKAAKALFEGLNKKLKPHVLGPSIPFIERIRNYYMQDIFVKLDRNISDLAKVKSWIKDTAESLSQVQAYKNVQLVMDIDP